MICERGLEDQEETRQLFLFSFDIQGFSFLACFYSSDPQNTPQCPGPSTSTAWDSHVGGQVHDPSHKDEDEEVRQRVGARSIRQKVESDTLLADEQATGRVEGQVCRWCQAGGVAP